MQPQTSGGRLRWLWLLLGGALIVLAVSLLRPGPQTAADEVCDPRCFAEQARQAAELEQKKAWAEEKRRIDQMVPDEGGPEGLVLVHTDVMRNGSQVVAIGSVKNNTSRNGMAILDVTLFLNGQPVDKATVRVSVPAGEYRGWSQPFLRSVSAGERWTATATVE